LPFFLRNQGIRKQHSEISVFYGGAQRSTDAEAVDNLLELDSALGLDPA
jgi:hypothetical protein